jgi:hypothetical protein
MCAGCESYQAGIGDVPREILQHLKLNSAQQLENDTLNENLARQTPVACAAEGAPGRNFRTQSTVS